MLFLCWQSASALQQFNEEMEGDFRLMTRKPIWSRAIDKFIDAALGKDKAVQDCTPALMEHLATVLGLAEPELTPNSTAVVGWHPNDNSMLKVFYGTESAELQPGHNVREIVKGNATQNVTKGVWRVMKGGEPEMENAHGLERTSTNHRSVRTHGTRPVLLVCMHACLFVPRCMRIARRPPYALIYVFPRVSVASRSPHDPRS